MIPWAYWDKSLLNSMMKGVLYHPSPKLLIHVIRNRLNLDRLDALFTIQPSLAAIRTIGLTPQLAMVPTASCIAPSLDSIGQQGFDVSSKKELPGWWYHLCFRVPCPHKSIQIHNGLSFS